MKENKQQKWSYSRNGECYEEPCETKEIAIERGKELAKDAEQSYFYIGKVLPTPIILSEIDVDSMIESIAEEHYDEYGEYAEDAFNEFGNRKGHEEEFEELEANMKKIFEDWATKYNRLPRWYHISDAEKIEI